MPTSPPLTGPARSIGAGYTHSNGALKQIRLARTLSQWLINLATHLALSAVFFPTYLLTLHASGGYSVMIRDIAGPLRAEFPACDTKPQVDCDTEADLKDMREEATYECRKLFKRSLGVLLVSVAASQLPYDRAHLLGLAVALTSVEGLYVSHAVKHFVQSVTKSPCQSPIGFWTATQRGMASTVMAIPKAHILWYYLVTVFCILWYFENPLVAPPLDFLLSFSNKLDEEVRQIQPIAASKAVVTLPVMRSIALAGLAVVAIRVVVIRAVICNLRVAQPRGGQPEHSDAPCPKT